MASMAIGRAIHLEAVIRHCSASFMLTFIVIPKSLSFIHRLVPPISEPSHDLLVFPLTVCS